MNLGVLMLLGGKCAETESPLTGADASLGSNALMSSCTSESCGY